MCIAFQFVDSTIVCVSIVVPFFVLNIWPDCAMASKPCKDKIMAFMPYKALKWLKAIFRFYMQIALHFHLIYLFSMFSIWVNPYSSVWCDPLHLCFRLMALIKNFLGKIFSIRFCPLSFPEIQIFWESEGNFSKSFQNLFFYYFY